MKHCANFGIEGKIDLNVGVFSLPQVIQAREVSLICVDQRISNKSSIIGESVVSESLCS